MTRHDAERLRDRSCAERGTDEPALVVDVEGFEGPLDLLLALARQQKVDLAKISILALAEQYLAFIEAARQAAARARRRLSGDGGLARLSEVAPAAAGAGAGPTGRAPRTWRNALALRLKRLEAIREVADQLMGRPQLDRDVFARGDPEPIADIKHPQWTATLYDLLIGLCHAAPAAARSAHVRFKQRTVWSLPEAREALERLIGQARDWTPARRIPDRLSGRAGDARDRDGVELRGHPRTGARGRRSRCTSKRRSRRSICASATMRRWRRQSSAATHARDGMNNA